MAIPATPTPTTSRTLLEYTIGNPNDFPNNTSSRAFGNPAQSFVPNLGTPSYVVLAVDSILVTYTIPANAGATFTNTAVSGTATFPNFPTPLVTGPSESVYMLLFPQVPTASSQFLPSSQTSAITASIKNGTVLIPITSTCGATGQAQGAVTSVKDFQPLPTSTIITTFGLKFTQNFINTVAGPAVGSATQVFTAMLLINTGYVALI